MENNHNTQEHSAKLSDSKLTQLQHQEQQNSLNLTELIKRRPWLIWIGALVFLYSITAISVSSLLQTQTNSVIQQEPESTSVTAKNPTATTEWSPRRLLHLWLLGAVAFSFVAGSLVIAKQLKVKHPATQVLTRRQLRRRRERHFPTVSTTTMETPLPVALPMLATTEHQVTVPLSEEKHLVAASVESSVEVTLPPLDQSQALDSGEVSLVEMMDIRKHLPLSVILGDSNKFRSYTDELVDKPVENRG